MTIKITIELTSGKKILLTQDEYKELVAELAASNPVKKQSKPGPRNIEKPHELYPNWPNQPSIFPAIPGTPWPNPGIVPYSLSGGQYKITTGEASLPHTGTEISHN